jgi:hypothetical protein
MKRDGNPRGEGDENAMKKGSHADVVRNGAGSLQTKAFPFFGYKAGYCPAAFNRFYFKKKEPASGERRLFLILGLAMMSAVRGFSGNKEIVS